MGKKKKKKKREGLGTSSSNKGREEGGRARKWDSRKGRIFEIQTGILWATALLDPRGVQRDQEWVMSLGGVIGFGIFFL